MYYAVLLIGMVLSAVNDKKRISFIVYISVLLIFSFLRYGVGADYFSYKYLYSRINPLFLQEMRNGLDEQEIGFRLLSSLLKNLGLSYQLYISFISAVNIAFIAKTCLRFSKNPTLSLTIFFAFYYLVWVFSGLRQGLTIAIGIYALLHFMTRNKHVQFVLIVAVLTTIHFSALILLPMYIASKINFKKRDLILLTLCSILIALFPLDLLLVRFSGNLFVDKVLRYVDRTTAYEKIFNFQSIGRLCFLVIICFYYNGYKKQDDLSTKIINLYIIGIIIYFLLNFSELTASRLSIYGKVLDIIILSNIYYLYKARINKFIYALCLCVLSFLYLTKEIRSIKSQTGLITEKRFFIPYTNIFNAENYSFDNLYYRITKDQ